MPYPKWSFLSQKNKKKGSVVQCHNIQNKSSNNSMFFFAGEARQAGGSKTRKNTTLCIEVEIFKTFFLLCKINLAATVENVGNSKNIYFEF